MAAYPGTDSTPMGEVHLTVFPNYDIIIEIDAKGLAPSCNAATNTNLNGCGVHIHEGNTCNTASLVGGHFWSTAKSVEDPWVDIRYDSNGAGESNDVVGVIRGNGYDADINFARALLLHDETGARIACGLLEHHD